MFTSFRRPLTQPRRLICFPFAGGGESHFRDWPGEIPDTDVVVARLAGRESRFSEPLKTDFSAVLTELVESIEPYLGDETTLFGHSLGGLLAFEVARSLEARGRGPALVIISGCDAPRTIVSISEPRDPTDAELLAYLAQRAVIPEKALANDELMRLMLPAFRADLRVMASYRVDPAAQPLNASVHLYYGVEEELAPDRWRQTWAGVVRGPISTSGFPGGHHFLVTARRELLDAVRKDVARAQVP